MTLGLVYKPKPWLWFRPEARYDWAQFTRPFSDGTRGSQLTLAIDVILQFSRGFCGTRRLHRNRQFGRSDGLCPVGSAHVICLPHGSDGVSGRGCSSAHNESQFRATGARTIVPEGVRQPGSIPVAPTGSQRQFPSLVANATGDGI